MKPTELTSRRLTRGALLLGFILAGAGGRAQCPLEPFQMGISLSDTAATLSVAGPFNELFLVESSSNLTTWRAVRTNNLSDGFRDLDIGPAAMRQGFFRSRRFEDSAGCASFELAEARVSPALIAAAGQCPLNGPPDMPAVRNAAIPSALTHVKMIRLMFHILAEDDGSGQAAEVDQITLAVATLNQHFLPSRIQFVHTTRIVRSSAFLSLDSVTEDASMKMAIGITPSVQHNVFVVAKINHTVDAKQLSAYSIFPWDPRSLTSLDGTIVQGSLLGCQRACLTHEIGHAFGLYHTHHGVAEVELCSSCYEPANGVDGDTTGDRCSDTPATPQLYDSGGCVPPAGNDPCSGGTSWSASHYQNFMSYAGCRSEFTAQQAGRMHAWIDYQLHGWLDTTTPAAPSDLLASANPGEVQLSWRDNSWNETSFSIERSVAGAPWFEIATRGTDAVSFTDLTAPPLTACRYRVRAFNGATPSLYSGEVAIITARAPDTFYADFRNASPPFLGTLADPFQTVRQAHDALNQPARLLIQSGTYPENFEMTKNLLLEPRGGDVLLGTP